ncbi:MAG: penicillin-binding protein 1A [Haliangiales bacterium]
MWYVRQPAEIVHRQRDSGLTLCWKVPLALLIWSLWAAPLAAALAAWVTVRTYTAELPPVPDLAQAEALLPQTSYIVASDGTVLAEIPFRDGEVVGHRVLVSAYELPEALVSALLAAEDVRFFDHRGVDARAVLRAAIANYEAGAVVEGASTITQQVVRALLPERIGYERSLRRKVREAVLAWRLERVYGKHEILQIYANQVFLGANAYGVAAAARAYFDKPLAALDLAQVAMIAGLVQAPGRADPYRDRAAARARRDQVLARMERAGLASSAEVTAAMAQPIALTSPPLAYGTLAPWHTERVRREVEASWPEAYQRGGLRIESAAEPGLSLLAEDTARAWLGRLAGDTGGAAGPQVGALIWDYQSGYVEATLGGRSFAESRFDRATQACRQPGSAFKPLVYAAALAADIITPATILRDAPITVYDDARDVFWKPRSGRTFRGPVLAQDALAASLNPPAIDVFERVGPARVHAVARGLGITTELSSLRPVALGASCVIPLELARAYAAFAGDGAVPTPVFVKRVTRAGAALIDRSSLSDPWLSPAHRLDRLAARGGAVSGTAAADALAGVADAPAGVDRETAFLVRDMLADVVRRGTATAARRLDREVAGKTGTTNDNTDAWFVGFSARVVAAVWLGYDDPSRTLGPRQDGSHAALPLWIKLVAAAEADRPRGPIPGPPPSALESWTIDRETGRLAAPGASGATSLWFKPGTAPVVEAGAVVEAPADLGRLSREF